MLYLHRYKVVSFFFLSLLFTVFAAQGQNKVQNKEKILVKNLPNYDDRKMHYGFYLGGTATTFRAEHSQNFVDSLSKGGIVTAANPKFTPGFTLGFVISRHLGDFFDLRFVPGVGFYTRTVAFEVKGEKDEQDVLATTVQLPFLLKYSSKRRKNSRMYFVGGITPAIDVGGSKRNERVENKLRVDKNNFLIEYGVGLDLFYPFFKFAPELRVAHGIPNLLIPDNNKYSRSFSSLATNSVTLYLFFE